MKKSEYAALCRTALVRHLFHEIAECANLTDYDPAEDEVICNIIDAIHYAASDVTFYAQNVAMDTEVF